MLTLSITPISHIRLSAAVRKGSGLKRHHIVILLVTGVLAACAQTREPPTLQPSPAAHAAARTGFDAAVQALFEGRMPPGALALAQERTSLTTRPMDPAPEGWSDLDLATTPDLGLPSVSFEEAQRLNAYLPMAADVGPAATPFVLKASKAERDRALLCLTQAVYYEAALEPPEGQEAVAQTVINRVRNPNFPKSICGVVYQGSSQITGCQFSFTCDGSRARPPIEPFWTRAKGVAERALDGYVMPGTGLSTHYHADYVFPRWGPTLVKIRQFGAQIFYRFPGPAGQPSSFRERYRGGELKVSLTGPPPEAILAYKASQLGGLTPPAAPGSETYTVTDPATGAVVTRVAGRIPGRRDPTPEEVSRINSVLAAMADAKSD